MQHRAHFDATVEFVNGGSLTASGFRLDVPTDDVSSDDVSRLFVQHLGLALVGTVTLANLEIVEEQHRGSRGIEVVERSSRRVIDVSHVIREGLITYPGLPAPVITPHLTYADSRSHHASAPNSRWTSSR